MATTRATARRLCNDREYELVEASFAPALNRLDAKTLNGFVARARRQRDKMRGQAEGRAREIQGKADQRRRAPARSNMLTVAKQKLFDETLARFEKRREKLQAMEARKKQTQLAKKALAKKRAADGDGAQRPASRTARRGMRATEDPNRSKGHFPAQGTKKGVVSAQIKRGQARRDSRG